MTTVRATSTLLALSRSPQLFLNPHSPSHLLPTHSNPFVPALSLFSKPNMPQAPSTRWCPTPEQLMILEEMYRSGIRTPNASQIQQITAHLSYYGKIEGKNVFYWFQNHKARDRQKMRRRLSRHQQLIQGASQMMPQQPPSPQQVFQMELPHPPLHHFPYYQSSPHFLHQGNCSESTPVTNLVCKLDSCGREGEMERSPVAKAATGKEWMTMMDMATTSTSAPPCCGTLKTLDLFPTTSTGLRDDYGTTSKSSSCSTSTTN